MSDDIVPIGRHPHNDDDRAEKDTREIFERALAEKSSLLLVTAKTLPNGQYDTYDSRLYLDDYGKSVVMLGDLVRMLVVGTGTPLLTVLSDIKCAVRDAREGS